MFSLIWIKMTLYSTNVRIYIKNAIQNTICEHDKQKDRADIRELALHLFNKNIYFQMYFPNLEPISQS